MTLSISSAAHLRYTIKGRYYHCTKCSHKTKQFTNIVDHVRLKDCKPKKKRQYTRNKTKSVLEYIQKKPGLYQFQIARNLGYSKSKEIGHCTYYLRKQGKIVFINGALYPLEVSN